MRRRSFLKGLAAAIAMPTMLREMVSTPEPEVFDQVGSIETFSLIEGETLRSVKVTYSWDLGAVYAAEKDKTTSIDLGTWETYK